MKKNIRIAIRIDSRLHAFLQQEAEKLDISVGQYVRQVVKEKQDALCKQSRPS